MPDNDNDSDAHRLGVAVRKTTECALFHSDNPKEAMDVALAAVGNIAELIETMAFQEGRNSYRNSAASEKTKSGEDVDV